MSIQRWKVAVLAFVLAASNALIPAFVGTTQAATREDIILLGASTPVVTKTYPPLLTLPPRQGTATVNPLYCKRDDATWCDQVRLSMDPQGKYALYSVKVSLSWPGPHMTKDNSEGNDLTLGVWEPDPASVDPTYDGKTRGAWTGTSYAQPEVVFVGTDSPDPKEFYLIINNRSTDTQLPSARNKGYTIRAEFVETDLGEIPGSKKGQNNTFSYTPPVPKANTKPLTTSSDPGAPEPDETIKVKVPGPDGELVEMSVPVFVKSESKENEDKGIPPVVPIILGVLTLGAGSFLYFFVFRRRAAA